jgi:hypothetical protein
MADCHGPLLSRYDVIRTIEAALEPHRQRDFTLPGVGYGALGGFPSGMLPELGFATWRWIKLDNAKANLSEDGRHALTDSSAVSLTWGQGTHRTIAPTSSASSARSPPACSHELWPRPITRQRQFSNPLRFSF